MACFCAVYLMGWSKDKAKVKQLQIQKAALTVACWVRNKSPWYLPSGLKDRQYRFVGKIE